MTHTTCIDVSLLHVWAEKKKRRKKKLIARGKKGAAREEDRRRDQTVSYVQIVEKVKDVQKEVLLDVTNYFHAHRCDTWIWDGNRWQRDPNELVLCKLRSFVYASMSMNMLA